MKPVAASFLLLLAFCVFTGWICARTVKPAMVDITIYLPKQAADPTEDAKHFPLQRKIPKPSSLRDSIKSVLEILFNGPTDFEGKEGFFSPFPNRREITHYMQQQTANERDSLGWSPSDTVVRVDNVWFDGDTVVVQFGHSMLAYGGGSTRVGYMINSLDMTLQQSSNIHKAKYLICGVRHNEVFQP